MTLTRSSPSRCLTSETSLPCKNSKAAHQGTHKLSRSRQTHQKGKRTSPSNCQVNKHLPEVPTTERLVNQTSSNTLRQITETILLASVEARDSKRLLQMLQKNSMVTAGG